MIYKYGHISFVINYQNIKIIVKQPTGRTARTEPNEVDGDVLHVGFRVEVTWMLYMSAHKKTLIGFTTI